MEITLHVANGTIKLKVDPRNEHYFREAAEEIEKKLIECNFMSIFVL